MDDSRLDELLDRYQELVDDGRVPDLNELCRDCPDLGPELGRRVARLRKLGRVLGDPDALPPTIERAHPSLSDDPTWMSGSGGREPTSVEIPAPPGYEVIEPLGEGGMGVVYKARQTGLGRLVALKMILGGARARAIDLTRFRDEAQAIAALKHPNIVQIYDLGEFRNQPYFALEYCAGGTLARALNGQPQPSALAARMAEVLAGAIQSAHDRNIIHRDLKPGNVLLAIESKSSSGAQSTMVGEGPGADGAHDALGDPEATFKVTDFGLAKRVDDDSGRTLDGSVMGTPSYMAPEQARGDLKAVGRSADVWAVGAVLYELLTGRPPFKGSTVLETLEQVRARDPVPVRQLQPRVPTDLETICLKCLEKDPARRYASAAALADDLRRFRNGHPILARPVGQLTRAYRWCRREPRTALLVAAVLVLTALLPAFLVGYEGRLARTRERLGEQEKLTAAAIRAEQAAYQAAETNRYYAALSHAGRLRAQPRPGWTWEAREQVLAAAAANFHDRDVVALRSELAAARGGIDLRPVGTAADGQQAGALAFAPDGRLAVAPQFIIPYVVERNVRVLDPRTGATRDLPFRVELPRGGRTPDMVTALAFSPDNRWLALGLRNGAVFRWDLGPEPAAPRHDWQAHTGAVAGLVFSPDSRMLYTAGHDAQVKRWSVSGTEKTPAASGPGAPSDREPARFASLAYWTGDRPGLLAYGPSGCRYLDPDTLTEQKPAGDWQPPCINGSYGTIAAHPPTGTVVVQKAGAVELVYWEGGICQTVTALRDPALEEPTAHAARIETMAVHPSGMLLATVSPNGGLAKVWDLAAGELAAAVPAPYGRTVAFSPDGRTLAVGGDHTTTLYEIGGLRELTCLGRRGLPVRAVGLTADGHVATIAARKTSDGANTADTVAMVWSPDGSPLRTVLHRANSRVVTEDYRVAGSGQGTVFHAGDGKLVWADAKGIEAVETDLKADGRLDVAVDADGQVWHIDGAQLWVRAPMARAKPRSVGLGFNFGGRKELTCVKAAGGLVAVGGNNGYLRVLRSDGGPLREYACFEESAATRFTERANTVQALDVRDDRQAVAGTEDGRLWLFDLASGTRLAHWWAHTGRVTAVVFDRTGDWLASGGRDREVHLWKRSGSNYELYLTLSSGRSVRQVLFAPDGRRLLVLREGDTAVRVWDLEILRNQFREANLE
jgi:serine/threonine protein kinase/WD40 repeat protein